MHVILNPLGSHGDVHPFVALGLALQARGHRISLVSSAAFEELATRHGFAFHAIGTLDDYQKIITNPELWHPKKNFEVLFGGEPFERMLRQTYFTLAELVQQPESAIVAGSLSFAARLVQEKHGTPFASVHLQPLALFSVVDPPATATLLMRSWWPIWFRRLLLWIGRRKYVEPLIRPPINRLRQEIGLRASRDFFGHWRHSTDRILGLFPEWFATAPDWPTQTRLTGFLRYDQTDLKPTPPALQAFLQAGPAPVIFSFGSAMRTGGPYFHAAVEACRQANIRGVLLAKGGDQIPTQLPENVVHADYAPFSEVFPQASMVVHHGGIGTTAQALTAGVPQLIMPMAFDQPDNAVRLERLGVARVLLPQHFTPENLTRELHELQANSQYLQTAQKLAQRLQHDQALTMTCELVEALLSPKG